MCISQCPKGGGLSDDSLLYVFHGAPIVLSSLGGGVLFYMKCYASLLYVEENNVKQNHI